MCSNYTNMNTVLNLDPNFKPYAGTDIEFEKFIFSGGEPHIRLKNIENISSADVTIRIRSFEDLGFLLLGTDALRQNNIRLETLTLPYFPAARQDRVMNSGEPLTVKIYAQLINQIGFAKVIILDAHSDVTPAVLNNCRNVPNTKFIQQVIQDIQASVILVSPDAGASKKVSKLSTELGGIEVIECGKTRNVQNGQLTSFRVYADDLQQKDCLIVDDICDGGSTFIGLAKELKNKNAGRLFLAVTHGIFTHGFEELSQYFDRIYTTNSFKELNHNCLTQIRLDSGLLS